MLRTRVIVLSLLAVFALSAVASASASAAFPELEWQTCQEKAGGKFENHGCVKEGTTKTFEWETLGAGVTKNVESHIKSGTTFVLKASGIEVKCTVVNDTGTITGGKPGTDEATEILFTKCTTSVSGCKVKTATKKAEEILVSDIKTTLVEGETAAGVKVVADEFAGKGVEEEFVTLEFGKKEKSGKLEEKCSTTIPLTTKVEGKVYAISQEPGLPLAGLLKFPTGGLKTPKTTLQVFGLGAELTGEEEETLATGAEKGWAIRSI